MIKSGASITPADLIAGYRKQTLAIQVKATNPTKKDYDELLAASGLWWVPWVMLWKPKGARTWHHQVAFMGAINKALEGHVLEPRPRKATQ